MQSLYTGNSVPKLESGSASLYSKKNEKRRTKGMSEGDIVFHNHLSIRQKSSADVAASDAGGNNIQVEKNTGYKHVNRGAKRGLKTVDLRMGKGESDTVVVGSPTSSYYTGRLTAEGGMSPGSDGIATNEEILFDRKSLPVKMKSHGFASYSEGKSDDAANVLWSTNGGAIHGDDVGDLLDTGYRVLKKGIDRRRITWLDRTGGQPVAETGKVMSAAFFSGDIAAGINDSSKIIAEGRDAQATSKYSGANWQDNSVAGQIGYKLVMLLRDGIGKASIHLDPPELGRIKVEIITKDKVVRAHIATEHPVVKGIIEANLGTLKDAMNAGGMTLDNLNVSVGGSGIFGHGENASPFLSEGWGNGGGMRGGVASKGIIRLNAMRNGVNLSGGLDIFV